MCLRRFCVLGVALNARGAEFFHGFGLSVNRARQVCYDNRVPAAISTSVDFRPVDSSRWLSRLGPNGTGMTHIAPHLGMAVCPERVSVSFTTAAALVDELEEARDERRQL